MLPIFKANSSIDDDSPKERLTRFKKCHVRDAPRISNDAPGTPQIEPTRAERREARKLAQKEQIESVKNALKPMDEAPRVAPKSQASKPISVDILRRALPLRSANKTR